jgi:LmbE family N-acetylglucosaminyl deacetylase
VTTPARALAIGSHPDDIEFGCGATLAKWASGGCVVSHLVCTDGSKGSWDVHEDRAQLIVTRQAEQRAAAVALGATGECVFLDAVDGELEVTLERRRELAYWIRVLRPVVVLGHDPWKRYRLHPDHRAAGFLTIDAVVAARDPHFFGDQGVPHHRPDELWLFEADEPDHVEDVAVDDGAFVDAKLDALLAHRSQWRSTHGIDGPGDADGIAAFRDRVAGEITAAGGEAFRRIVTL